MSQDTSTRLLSCRAAAGGGACAPQPPSALGGVLTDCEKESMAMNTPARAPSYEHDIKPLFRASDRASMAKKFDLWSYQDVQVHAAAIEAALSTGIMPCDGAWPAAQIAQFQDWVTSGMAP